jgi:hypothetical protein
MGSKISEGVALQNKFLKTDLGDYQMYMMLWMHLGK